MFASSSHIMPICDWPVSIFSQVKIMLHFEMIPFLDIRVTTALILVVVLWYYLFWQPFDWNQDFTDLGFDSIKSTHRKYSEVTKRNVINEYHQRRRLGDLPPVYPNGWFHILESDQLKPAAVQEVCALGLNLVAWRGESGKAYVADAYCPHLGAHLGVGGTVKGECITCPFHGWQFEGYSGSLVNIPYSECSKLEHAAKIKTYSTVEQNGFIYLWYHAEDAEPYWAPPPIPEIESGAWVYRGRVELRVACHIQDVCENTADVNHFDVVHGANFLAGQRPLNSWLSALDVQHRWGVQWKASDDEGENHVAVMQLTHQLQFYGYKLPLMAVNSRYIQIGPGISYVELDTVLGRGIIVHTITPVQPMLQKVNSRFYSARSLLHPVALLTLFMEAVMIPRDMPIWNRKMHLRNPVLPKEDSTIRRFRKWYQQFYSENSPRHYFTRNESCTDFIEL